MNWQYNPQDFEPQEYSVIPAGDHRVRIAEVAEKVFKSGNSGYEITFNVSGFSSKLWFYLVLDPADTKKTNQRIGSFFESFGITDYNMAHFRAWVGKVGAIRVKHEDYNGTTSAKVAFCLARKNQDKLPPAKFGDMPQTTGGFVPTFDDSELPFN